MYFENIFSPYISGFQKGHSCESVLLRLVENVKLNMDNGSMYGALLTDLSKAFECLPHRLLIAKLKAYGLSNDSCMLIANYFQDRTQRVKVGNVKSDWMEINKGCPQGSLFGPLAFNIFSNDLLLLVQDRCDVYNYADDFLVGYKLCFPSILTGSILVFYLNICFFYYLSKLIILTMTSRIPCIFFLEGRFKGIYLRERNFTLPYLVLEIMMTAK